MEGELAAEAKNTKTKILPETPPYYLKTRQAKEGEDKDRGLFPSLL